MPRPACRHDGAGTQVAAGPPSRLRWPPLPAAPLTAIVADDSSAFRSVLVELLEALAGVTCVGEASSADEAIALCLETTPDVVLMDVRMPGRDGFAAAAEIHARLPETAVVLLSAGPNESSGDADSAGVFALLDKQTLRIETLEALLDRLAGSR